MADSQAHDDSKLQVKKLETELETQRQAVEDELAQLQQQIDEKDEQIDKFTEDTEILQETNQKELEEITETAATEI